MSTAGLCESRLERKVVRGLSAMFLWGQCRLAIEVILSEGPLFTRLQSCSHSELTFFPFVQHNGNFPHLGSLPVHILSGHSLFCWSLLTGWVNSSEKPSWITHSSKKVACDYP